MLSLLLPKLVPGLLHLLLQLLHLTGLAVDGLVQLRFKGRIVFARQSVLVNIAHFWLFHNHQLAVEVALLELDAFVALEHGIVGKVQANTFVMPVFWIARDNLTGADRVLIGRAAWLVVDYKVPGS